MIRRCENHSEQSKNFSGESKKPPRSYLIVLIPAPCAISPNKYDQEEEFPQFFRISQYTCNLDDHYKNTRQLYFDGSEGYSCFTSSWHWDNGRFGRSQQLASEFCPMVNLSFSSISILASQIEIWQRCDCDAPLPCTTWFTTIWSVEGLITGTLGWDCCTTEL